MDFLNNIDFEKYAQLIMEVTKDIAPKILMALLTLYIGFKITKWLSNMVEKTMQKHKVDISLRKFLSSLISIGLKVLVIVSVASTLGIETTSFIAILGAAGLAIGLALQGSLSNLAGGVLIIFFKPFKVGDLIEAQGHIGEVESIQIFATVLHTKDNKTVIIPNGDLSNGSIINYTAQKTRRVDMTFGIGYGDDIKKAKEILYDIMKADKRILTKPAPFVGLAELADSSVNFTVRPWAKTDDYWGVYFDLNESVKEAFDKEGISIPFPQRDVHLHKVT